MSTIKRPKISDTTTIVMDCGCKVEISMVRISADDPKYYRGGKVIEFCENHKLPFQKSDMLEEAFRRYDRKILESTEQGQFVIKKCPFYECKNRILCLKNGYVCPAMVMVNNRQAEA